ncbi:hypothetical protein C9J85_02555 [Haloferax sp. wsp5]|nr:hypothetical protein C9J85_02555 [Haloferax sp. wsp5]
MCAVDIRLPAVTRRQRRFASSPGSSDGEQIADDPERTAKQDDEPEGLTGVSIPGKPTIH